MSFPDTCPSCGRVTSKPHVDGCDASAEEDAEKARLFDWLAAHSHEWRKTDDWDKGECDECGDYRWHLFLYTNGESTLALCNGCGEALVTGEYTKAMEAEGER